SLWLLSPWRPRAELDWKLMGELLQFGKWALLSSLLAWFYAWMDALVVGHYLGSHDMGLYRTGNSLVTMVFGLIFTPLLPVLYALFSRAQRDIPRIRKSVPVVARTMALIGLP